MLTPTVVALGVLAGFTIYVSMPVARMRRLAPATRAFVGAFTAGVLVFLFFDVVASALALPGFGAGPAGAVKVALFLGVFLLALGGLALFERLYRVPAEPLASTPADASAVAPPPRPPALRAMNLIAVGIGLHNFAEGLAIGTAYAAGAVSFTAVLVIGFAVHNSTEGFGVVGPALARNVVPSWRRLGALGAVAGGPTVLGATAGSLAYAPTLELLFLGLAAGAILYVVAELVYVAGRVAAPIVRALGLFAGFALGLVADLVASQAIGAH